MPANSGRKDAIKAYIVCLMQDGILTGSSSPGTIASKAIAAFSSDVWAAGGELANMAADSAIAGAGAKIETIARDMDERGMRAIWKDLQNKIAKK